MTGGVRGHRLSSAVIGCQRPRACRGIAIDDISQLLRAANAREPGALERLFAAAYGELRQLARSRLREGGRGTVLETTALVHESYLRLIQGGSLQGADRRAFFAYASRIMRSVIVDEVRRRQAERRGGELERLTLDTQLREQLSTADDEPLRVHEALDVLGAAEPRLAQVVEMRYFGGYSEVEIAETLGVTERTVRRDWEKARLLLSALLQPSS